MRSGLPTASFSAMAVRLVADVVVWHLLGMQGRAIGRTRIERSVASRDRCGAPAIRQRDALVGLGAGAGYIAAGTPAKIIKKIEYPAS